MKINAKLIKRKKKVASQYNPHRLKERVYGKDGKGGAGGYMVKLTKHMLLGRLTPRMSRHCGMIYRHQEGLVWAHSEQAQEGIYPFLGRDSI